MMRSSSSIDQVASDRSFDQPTTSAPMPGSARLVVKLLEKLSVGSLTVRFPDGRSHVF
jgi:hypothetical protein